MAERVLSARATVMGEFDVVVCRGGPAGVGAAVGAAREGASVLLVEATGCLGARTPTLQNRVLGHQPFGGPMSSAAGCPAERQLMHMLRSSQQNE